MKSSLLLSILFGLVTLPVALCLPSGYPNDLEMLTAEGQHRLAVREEASLEAEWTRARDDDDPMGMGQGSRKQRRWRKLSIRAEMDADDDEPTSEELDDFFEDEGEGRAARAETPTLEEYQWFLTPQERADFQAARLDWGLHPSALDVAQTAKAQGRNLTTEEEENLRYGRERAALYKKLRYQGIKRLVKNGKARPEVAAYWEERMQYYRKKTRAKLAQKTTEERKAHNEQKKVTYYKNKAARAALEERIKDETATAEDRQKWAKIQQAESKKAAKEVAKRARSKELEGKVRQEIPLTDDETKEWEAIVAKRKRAKENVKAYNERKKQGIKSREGNYKRGRPRKGTTDPPNSQPLQFSEHPGSSSVVPANGLLRDSEVAAIRWTAGVRSAQSGKVDRSSSGGFDISTMKHRVMGRMEQMRVTFLNGLGHVINQAGGHASTGPFVGGKSSIIKVP